ncbi:unnamed protein product [Caenorhabditis brenneri]
MFSRCKPFFRKKRTKNECISKTFQPNLRIMPVVVMEEVRENQDIQPIDPCHLNLQNMPLVVLEEVLKNLDYKSIFRLRKVCHDLRFSIDRIEPKLHVLYLSFQLPITTESLNSYMTHVSRNVKNFNMRHHESRTGCKIEWESEGTLRYLEITMEEAVTLLKNTKIILDQLKIDFLFAIVFEGQPITQKEEDLKKFYESLKSSLKNKGRLLETRSIFLQVHNLSEVAGLLKCIDPKSLKTIEIQTKNWSTKAIEMNFSEFETLEQWKNAEDLRIEGNYILTSIESFASFKTIDLWVAAFSIVKLNEVKELFVNSPKMETFIIKSDIIRLMMHQLKSNFGQFDSYDEEFGISPVFRIRNLERKTWTWLKDVPGSTEKLQIILNIGLENYIMFSKV